MRDWREYLYSFKGRATRAQFWIMLLVQMVTALTGELVIVQLTGSSFRAFTHEMGGQGIWSESGRHALLLMLPVWIFTISLSNATNVKRLHDRNRSGWWLMLLIYGPWLADFPLAAFRDPHSIPLTLIGWGDNLLGLWGVVELGILRGTKGANRFGPDPLRKTTEADAFS